MAIMDKRRMLTRFKHVELLRSGGQAEDLDNGPIVWFSIRILTMTTVVHVSTGIHENADVIQLVWAQFIPDDIARLKLRWS